MRFPAAPRFSPAPASRLPALASALLLLLSGCGRPASGPQDVLFHAVSSPPFVSLDPAVEKSEGVGVLRNVYETLTVYDDLDGQVKPCLAESWESNATMTEWTFSLRRDVVFHDGSRLTAAAVKKSIDRVMFLGRSSSYIWDCVSSLEATNAYTIVFRLKYAAPLPLIASSSCAAYIISPAAASRDESWFNMGNDAGSGPYRIAAASRSSVSLESFGGYRDGWPKGSYRKVYVAEVPSQQRRTEYMESGRCDIAFFPDQERILGSGGCALDFSPSWESQVMMFNSEQAPCSSEDFRKALAYAFPYEETVGRIFRGRSTFAKGIVPPGLWSHDEGLPSYSCDLGRAREFLERSGLGGATLILAYQPGQSGIDEALELYRQNLESLGLTLVLMKADWETQQKMAQVRSPEARPDIMLTSWWPDYADPSGIFKLLLTDQGRGRGFGLGRLHDAEASLSVQTASILALENRDGAEKIYRRLQQNVFDSCSLVFLYNAAVPIASRKGISGVRINPAYASCIYYYSLRR